MTRVLLVGSGAREDAIAHALIRRPDVELYAAMSSANPGITRITKDRRIMQITNPLEVVDYAVKNRTEIAIVGPEAPLVKGVANALKNKGIACVGPTRELAAIEGDKVFCRQLLNQHGISGNPQFNIFADFPSAEAYLRTTGDVAIKPIGLTAGKGVKVSGDELPTKEAEIAYAKHVLNERIGGEGVLIEEKLDGEEYSLQAFVDGKNMRIMPLVQDHKRAFDNDMGPNTGGMGSYSDVNHLLPFVSEADLDQSCRIMREAIDALQQDMDAEYKGVLYGQFMIAKNRTEDRPSPKLIEFNCRFGDPEAMNVLSILDSDLADICERIIDGTLGPQHLQFLHKATVCKYLVPDGYPEAPRTHEMISLDEGSIANSGVTLHFASVDAQNGRILTTSSRTVALTAISDTIEQAEKLVEASIQHVRGPLRHRRDIGTSALISRRLEHARIVKQPTEARRES